MITDSDLNLICNKFSKLLPQPGAARIIIVTTIVYEIAFYIKLKLFYFYVTRICSYTIGIWFDKSGVIIFKVTPVTLDKERENSVLIIACV